MHRARKRFGQNFLQNSIVINNIIQSVNPLASDNLVEIGPGLGALTIPLLKQVNHLTAIEIDNDLNTYWSQKSCSNLTLIHKDALTVDYSELGSDLRILGNLPYNIATTLLLYLIKYLTCIKDLHFMLQKEVVERLVAIPSTKAWGRLSIIIQYHYEVSHLFNVSADNFYPKPQVESAIVCLRPRPIGFYPKVDRSKLEKLVLQAFAMRRKTLGNNLKNIITTQQLLDLDLDPKSRPEQNDIFNYIKIVNFLTH